MYRKFAAIVFPVLTLALVFAMLWGSQQKSQRQQMTIKAENEYQRSFHMLVYQVQQIGAQLGNSLAVDGKSSAFQRENLLSISRLTSDAQNAVNQLPLAMSPFYQTQQFLNNLSQFTYTIASRDMIKQPITTDDQNKLSQLHVYAKQLYGQLDRLQKTVIQQRLKWTDAEKAYAANQNKGHLKNPIVDGFQQLDKSVGNYKELDWGPTITGTVPQAHLATSQRPIKTPTKIRQLVIQKFNLQPHTAIQLKANGNGHYFKSYSVKTTDADGHTILADFAKAGGDMLWFSNRRPVGKTTVTDMRAVEEAKQWLAAWHMPTFEPINQDRYDGVLVITMAELKQGVLHIPHRLTVQVALDNGEVIGMQASEFVMASHQPISIQPKLTLLQAKQHLRTNFQVKTVRLVTIADKAGNEVLCYAFQGQINSTKYRIYLDATTGDERQIEPIRT